MEQILGSKSFIMAVMLGVGLLFSAFLHVRRMRGLRCKKLPEPLKEHYPPAALVMALKGLDPGLRENLLAVLSQDHPDLQFVFAFESADDPAFSFVKELLQEVRMTKPELRASMVVAEISLQCSQKIANQLAALKHLSSVEQKGETVETFLFVDADIRPTKDFVRYLVHPLNELETGVTTGYRWYYPDPVSFSGLLCSTWNAGAFQAIVDPFLSFAWGGAMAIRREIFEQSGVEQSWQNSVSDDLSLTRMIRKNGLKIRFVPECVPITYEAPSLAETLEFTSRQMLIARIYHPALWWVASITHSLIIGFLAYGSVHLALWLASGDEVWLSGMGALALLPFFLIFVGGLIRGAADWLPEVASLVQKRCWLHVLMSPFASLLSVYSSIRNLMTRKICWRGIQYELVSPEKTIVKRPEVGTQCHTGEENTPHKG